MMASILAQEENPYDEFEDEEEYDDFEDYEDEADSFDDYAGLNDHNVNGDGGK